MIAHFQRISELDHPRVLALFLPPWLPLPVPRGSIPVRRDRPFRLTGIRRAPHKVPVPDRERTSEILSKLLLGFRELWCAIINVLSKQHRMTACSTR